MSVLVQYTVYLMLIVAVMLFGADLMAYLAHGGAFTTLSLDQVLSLFTKSGISEFHAWIGQHLPSILASSVAWIFKQTAWVVFGIAAVSTNVLTARGPAIDFSKGPARSTEPVKKGHDLFRYVQVFLSGVSLVALLSSLGTVRLNSAVGVIISAWNAFSSGFANIIVSLCSAVGITYQFDSPKPHILTFVLIMSIATGRAVARMVPGRSEAREALKYCGLNIFFFFLTDILIDPAIRSVMQFIGFDMSQVGTSTFFLLVVPLISTFTESVRNIREARTEDWLERTLSDADIEGQSSGMWAGAVELASISLDEGTGGVLFGVLFEMVLSAGALIVLDIVLSL